MLAGCSSSTLLSPRHRLRSEPSPQFHHQACHLQLPPSMSTQRLDLPACTFPRNNKVSPRPSVVTTNTNTNKPIEAKTSSYSLKQHIRLPPLATTPQLITSAPPSPFLEAKEEPFWDNNNNNRSLKKRPVDNDDSFDSRAKRKKGSNSNSNSTSDNGDSSDDVMEEEGTGEGLSLSANFWLQPSSLPPFSLTCSGEEERVCFVPSEVVSAPWVESAITKITNHGEKEGEGGGSRFPPPQPSASSNTSSESQGLSLRLNENPEVGNGSGNPYHNHHHEETTAEEDEDIQEEHRGFELVSLLTACVEAIGTKNIAAINHFIAKLGDLASPRGTSSMSRICSYFTEALAIRVTRLWPHIFHITIPRELDRVVEDENGTALRLLNQITPIPKFLHFTSNEMLLRAFEGKDRVHIIDFDIKQGLQWPSLFQSLASRSNPPSHVRITGIGESKQDLNETGDRLAGFAEALNLPFEFHGVVDRLEDVRLWMLHVKENETVAANCVFQLHKTLYDVNGGALRDFLGLIRSTNPAMVVVAEQEAEHNDMRLEARVCNSLKYYSALFDSVEHCLEGDSSARRKIEEMFGREIRNIVACEGSDRLERHEGFGKWRKMMVEQGGFRCLGVTERERVQSQLLMKMYPCDSYSVRNHSSEALSLCWMDIPLFTVSAWAPLDAAGTSSSVSQPI
ncbi:scarecrow-like protein 28 [Arachis duranensis]|uniref:Scarecrow-like protein 28 n=1 Tax=Arachis duranensis TaxID=130453 RepID=A0A6P4DGH9_ARADU|nr:scarecrow-like protein 28 [Arachis duranensis]XP_052118013.1 scarecrow-like protein 28 [Arachis duranensis]